MDPTPPAPDSPVVLVAEDEVLVRMMTVDVLEEAGCAVLEAANAEAALCVLHERSDVQVLVTDVEMPPGPLIGIDLARLTCERFPHMGVVIVSGKVRPSPDELPPGARFIPKPYSATKLTGVVQEVMIRAA
jgi:two-component system, response regulator PdtaR